MPNLILINATQRISGTKVQNFSPARPFALDINNIISPIRFDVTKGESYFTTRQLSGMDTSSRNNAQISFRTSDTLTVLAAQSDGLVALTVLFRRGKNMKSETMVFVTKKIREALDIVNSGFPNPGGGTRFFYTEEGDPDGVEYIVQQTPAAIVSAGVNPVFNMNGYELYVNDIVGNDATAEYGNPLLPWKTINAAITAAAVKVGIVGGPVNVILTGGNYTATNNIYSNGVNIEIRADASLTANVYLASGNGNQTIWGKGSLYIADANGMHLHTTFNGNITVNIGLFQASSAIGIQNSSASSGAINVICDYSIMSTGCQYLYLVNGTAQKGSFITNIMHTDSSTQRRSTYCIIPSALTGTAKYFNFYISSGTSVSSNQGMLSIGNIDDEYFISADITVNYNGSAGSPGVNAILSCIGATGGFIDLKGTHFITGGGRQALILNSAVKVNDYSICYQNSTNSVLKLSGGTSIYTLYGKKRAGATANTSAISLGETFTSANATTDFGTPSATAGTDTLHFKGALKCVTNSSKGIQVYNANPNLIIDAGIVEMVTMANDAFSAATPQNFMIYGTGFTNAVINVNLTNTIAGTNIVSDPGVVSAML